MVQHYCANAVFTACSVLGECCWLRLFLFGIIQRIIYIQLNTKVLEVSRD